MFSGKNFCVGTVQEYLFDSRTPNLLLHMKIKNDNCTEKKIADQNCSRKVK